MPPKKPGTGGTVAKIIVAALFLMVAPETEGSTVLVSLIIGLAFLAWAVLPYQRYRQEEADASAGRIFAARRPGVGATVSKIAAAALFIVMGFDLGERSDLTVSLAMGAACLVWAFLPYRRYRQTVAREEAVRNEALAASAAAKPGSAAPADGKAHYCPYCGAPKHGDRCEYCGM